MSAAPKHVEPSEPDERIDPLDDPSMFGAMFGEVVGAFDRATDTVFERFRGHPALDRVMTAATHAGEFSAIWHASGIVRGLARNRPDQIVALAIGIGAESLVVNQGLKRLFGRPRPTAGGDPRYTIRRPITSSFPSGHASAAGFAATVLIGWDGKRSAPLWGALAATVALSRPYVRIHHTSDIVAGAAVGVGMGLIARNVYRHLGVD